jgi:hypothetical protein
MASTTFSGPITSTAGFVGAVTGDVTGAVTFPTYAVAGAPSAATAGAGSVIYTTDGVAGSPGLAFSDGTNWKRADTPATTISAT